MWKRETRNCLTPAFKGAIIRFAFVAHRGWGLHARELAQFYFVCKTWKRVSKTIVNSFNEYRVALM